MAILENMGLQVQVLVNGTPAPEYQDQNAEDQGNDPRSGAPACHRYVESIAGSRFSISTAAISADNAAQNWLEAGDNHAYLFRISVDGNRVCSTWIDRKRKTCTSGSAWHHGTLRLLQFAAVDLIEDAAKELEAEHIEQLKDIGSIRVEVFAAIVSIRAKAASTRHHDHSPIPLGEGSLALSEKALKGRAITHGATLGPIDGKRTSSTTTKHWRFIDSRDRPRAVFTFAYRSKDALKQELIIPRSPSPAPSDVDDRSPKKIHRLSHERLSEIQGRKRGSRVKHEQAETPGRPLKFVRISGGREAIDLTDE